MKRFVPAFLGLGLLLGVPLAALAVGLRQTYRYKDTGSPATGPLAPDAPTPPYRPFVGLATGLPPIDPMDTEALQDAFGALSLDENFDPSDWDQMSVAGNARVIAYPAFSTRPDAGTGGLFRDVVVLRPHEDGPGLRLDEAAGDNDQPCARFDRDGLRVAFRGTSADGLTSDIHLHSVVQTTTGAPEERVRNVTGSQGRSFDPTLAALTRVFGVGGGITVRRRAAQVAFISDGDFARHNPTGAQQVFLWQEFGNRFNQLTFHDDLAASLNRPSIDGHARMIAFESTADLTPNAVNPADTSQVGNPAGVRQIYVWRAGKGVRQITWSTLDCFAPRVDRRGRVVLFSSRGDLVGANADANHEIFQWKRAARGARALRQLTDTSEGQNVLPRPTGGRSEFVFYSTGLVDDETDTFDGSQLGPGALSYRRGRIRAVAGRGDVSNFQRRELVLYGPPVPGTSLSRVHFATSDADLFTSRPFEPEDDAPITVATAFFNARATLFRGPPPPPFDLCSLGNGAPTGLTLSYQATKCTKKARNGQGANGCKDLSDAALPPVVRIVVRDTEEDGISTVVWFDDTVTIGSEFTFSVNDQPLGQRPVRLAEKTWVFVLDPASDEVLQKVRIRTDCEKPLFFQAVFGAVRLEDASYTPVSTNP